LKYLDFSRVLPEDVDGFILHRSGWLKLSLAGGRVNLNFLGL
jgi:hypothetical protein